MRKTNGLWPACLCLAGLLAVPAGLLAQETTASPAAAEAASGGLLEVIPADATAFMAIRNLKELDNDIVALSTQLGFPLGPEGIFPAPLDWLKMTLGIMEGLRENAGVAVVLLDSSNVKSVEELPDRLIIYVPATDPQALITSLGGEEGTDGIYRVNLAGSPSVAAIKDNFVLIAKAPEPGDDGKPEALVNAAKATGDGVVSAMSENRVKAYQEQDLFLWLNLKNISEPLRNEIATGLENLFKEMGNQPMVETQPENEVAFSMGAQINKFFEQGDEVTVGLSLSQKVGLKMFLYTRLAPDSEMGRMMAAMEPTKGPLLSGLPEEKFIVAGGAVIAITPEAVVQLRQQANQMAAQIAALDPDPGSPLTPEGLQPLIDMYVEAVKETKHAAISISNLAPPLPPVAPGEQAAPPAPVEGDVLGLTLVVEAEDAQAWRDRLREAFDEVKQVAAGVAKADGVEQEKIDQAMAAFIWKENVGEVAGASVDHMIVDVKKLPDAEMTPEETQQFKAVFGEDGLMLRIATLDKHVVITMGGGDERLAQVIELTGKGQAPLAKNKEIRSIAARLPKGNRVGEGYISFDNLLGVINTMAMRLDSPLPVRLSLVDAAPMAFVTQMVDETAQEVTVLLPTELVVSVADMARTQLLPLFMMGGMGGEMDGMNGMNGMEGMPPGFEEMPEEDGNGSGE